MFQIECKQSIFKQNHPHGAGGQVQQWQRNGHHIGGRIVDIIWHTLSYYQQHDYNASN